MEIKELTHDELDNIVQKITKEVFFHEQVGENFDSFVKEENDQIIVFICDKTNWRIPFRKDNRLSEFESCVKSFFKSVKDNVLYGC